MAEEKPPYEKTIAQLAGQVAALETLVAAIILHLPERAMESIKGSAADFRRFADQEARERQTDGWRDYSAAVWDTIDPIKDAIDQQIDELATGDKLRTIQPFPLDPKHHLPGRNF